MRFRCKQFNGGRPFDAASFYAAAERIGLSKYGTLLVRVVRPWHPRRPAYPPETRMTFALHRSPDITFTIEEVSP